MRPTIHKAAYTNGLKLRYAIAPLHSIRANLTVHVGGGYEQPGEEGVAHFCEHAVVAGGTTKRSPEDAARDFLRLGYANAKTSLEETRYEAGFLPRRLREYLDVVSDITHNAQFDPHIIERERKAIHGEIRRSLNNPDYERLNTFYRACFPINPNKRVGDTLGSPENVNRFCRDDLLRFHKQWTNRANMTLYLFGALPYDIENVVQEYFGDQDTPFSPFSYETDPPFSTVQYGSMVRPSATATTIMMAWRVPSDENPVEAIHLSVLADVLSGNEESGLFYELRIKRGLTYGAQASYESRFKQGLFVISTDLRQGSERETEQCILQTINTFQSGGISAETLANVKEKRELRYGQHLDDPFTTMNEMMARDKKGIDTEQMMGVIQNISIGDIQHAAANLPTDRYLLFKESAS